MLQTEFAKLLLIVGNLAYDHKLINDILLRHTNERVRQSRGGAPSYPQSLWFCLLPFLFAARYGFHMTSPGCQPHLAAWQPARHSCESDLDSAQLPFLIALIAVTYGR